MELYPLTMCYFIERTQKCTKLFFNHYLKQTLYSIGLLRMGGRWSLLSLLALLAVVLAETDFEDSSG